MSKRGGAPKPAVRAGWLTSLALAACIPGLARGAPPAGGEEGPGPTAFVPPRELPLPRPSLALALEGWRDRTRDGETVEAAVLSLRGSTSLLRRVQRRADGLSAWGLTAQVDARSMALELDRIRGQARFLRLGLSLGAYLIPSPRTSYSLSAGAFIAEQERLLGSPQVHPQVAAVGTYRSSEQLRFLYGAAYTYSLGRGLALPLLGVTWRWAPAWQLDVLLPAVARVTWRPREDLSLSWGAALAGGQYRYRAGLPPSHGGLEVLRLVHLRLGASGEVRLSPWARVGAMAGVEHSWIRAGASSQRAAGVYAGVSLGFGAPSSELPVIR